jgi:hypothetical protein
MSSSVVTYAPHPDATPDVEVSALANVYKFVLDCRAKKEATRPGSPDDAERSLNDGARSIIQDRK